jgi:hypothetical protein
MRPTTFESSAAAAAADGGGGASCAVFEEKLYDLTRQTITLAKARRSLFGPPAIRGLVLARSTSGRTAN